MKRWFLLIGLMIASPVLANTCTTAFPLTQNPIATETCGTWTNGLATGIQWGNVRTTTNLAFGTTTTSGCSFMTGDCNDSSATVNGVWGTNQNACATVFLSGSLVRNSNFYEIELRINTTITANNITGYELTFSTHDGSAGPYLQFNRWNGALNDFTLIGATTPSPVMANGMTVCATNIGGTLQATLNGTSQFTGGNTVVDHTYTGGNPGVGMFNQGGTTADNALFGWSTFSATDGLSSVPVAPAIGPFVELLKLMGWGQPKWLS